MHSVRNKSPVFDVLLNAGADITLQNHENGRTALHMAAAYNRQSMLKKCVNHRSATFEYIEIQDIQGDTALMIAVKLRKLELIKTITNKFNSINGINLMDQNSVLHIAVYYDRPDILAHLLLSTSSASIHYQDMKHRTPILYAAELDRNKCLQDLIEHGADYYQKNPETGETLLHVIARHHSNSSLPYLLKLPHISWFFMQKDYNGNTPYMSAIVTANDKFLREAFKLKKIDLCEHNADGETPTYYIAKQGFPSLLRTLLLSPKYYTFARKKENTIDINDPNEILKAEIRGDIYSTDVYILLKKVIKYPLIHYFPPNLITKIIHNRNIFHACAIGGNLECLEFLYEFYKLFAPKYFIDDFDAVGDLGNTPLLIAAQCGPASESCVQFFVQNGADLAATNKAGINVIQAIFSHNPDATHVFTKMFDSCVTAKKEYYFSDRLNIRINFSIFCPNKADAQTSVISLLFTETKGINDRRAILQHPVINVFLKQKLRYLRKLYYIRFIVLCIVTVVISTLIPLLYIIDNPTERHGLVLYTIMSVVFYFMVALSVLHCILKIPQMLKKELWFTDVVAIVPPISMITFVLIGKSFFFTPELAAIAILSWWFMILLFTVNIYSTFSYQISMFFRLLNSISKHLIVLIVVLFAFALSFSCLYHDDQRFSHIAISFLFTFTVMMPGLMSELPLFKQEYFTSTSKSNRFHFVVECIVVGAFIIVAIIGFVNMIVGLAVQGGRHLETDGKIFKNYHETHYLGSVEFWFRNKVFYWFSRKKMFKFLKVWKQRLYIPMTLDIYDKVNESICNDSIIRQLRSIVFKKLKHKLGAEPESGEADKFEDVFNNPFGHLPGAKDKKRTQANKSSVLKQKQSIKMGTMSLSQVKSLVGMSKSATLQPQ